MFRVFDALNDPRNMEWAMRCVKKYGGHAQGAICYTISPVHDNAAFVRGAQELKAMGADSICIKDMAALLTPYAAYDLVKMMKAEVGLPVHVHTHNTSGFAIATLVKAAEAGADIVDTAISSMAGSTSQALTESLAWPPSRSTERDTGLDLRLLNDIAGYFRMVRTEHLAQFETARRGRYPRAVVPDARWDDLQPGQPAPRARRRGSLGGRGENCPASRGHGYLPLVTPRARSWAPRQC